MEQKISTSNLVSVTNRNNGTTGYTLSNGIHRTFNLKETKKIDLEELRELSTIPGGDFLLKNYLIINDKSALDYLELNPEPEYFYTEEEIKTLLLSGSVDQLEDCLNFAPQGVIDLVKSLAIQLEIPDIRKRDLIFEKTGFNVNNAINVNKILDTESTDKTETETVQRKAQPINETTNTAAPTRKYNVVK